MKKMKKLYWNVWGDGYVWLYTDSQGVLWRLDKDMSQGWDANLSTSSGAILDGITLERERLSNGTRFIARTRKHLIELIEARVIE